MIGEDKSEKVTAGQVVKGMLLNRLGLVSSPLYLFNRFFQGITIENLIEPGVKAEYFNDDKLGRVLEQLYQKGLSKIFMSVVLEAVKTYQLETETVHIDSSSFEYHGYSYACITPGVFLMEIFTQILLQTLYFGTLMVEFTLSHSKKVLFEQYQYLLKFSHCCILPFCRAKCR